MVAEFRAKTKADTAGIGRKRAKFDFAAYFSQVSKGRRVDTGAKQIMMHFGSYCKHYQSLSFPLTLSLEQATRRWARELADPRHPKDKVRAPDADGLPRGEWVQRLAVNVSDYIDTSTYRDHSNTLQVGQRRDRPTDHTIAELQAGYVQPATCSLFRACWK